MKRTAIIYSSSHHGNTRKIAEAMKEAGDVDLFTVEEAKNVDFSGYDYIGFASGIYAFKFAEPIMKLAKDIRIREGQKAFAVYTCGLNIKNYASGLENIFKERNVEFAGKFSCRGYDTFGIFKLIGGIAKGCPNERDMERARAFIRKLAYI